MYNGRAGATVRRAPLGLSLPVGLNSEGLPDTDNARVVFAAPAGAIGEEERVMGDARHERRRAEDGRLGEDDANVLD